MVVVLWGVIVSSILCLTSAESNENCGTSVIPTVTRGREIVKGEYPWLAALYKPDELSKWTQFCGGALLSRSIIITAAHCLVNDQNEVLKPESVKVGLGKVYRDFYRTEDNSTIVNVTQVVVHRHFHGAMSNFALDVGLLKLNIDVKLSAYVLPVCFDLDTISTVRTGAIVHAAGWGTTENAASSERALAADLSYLDYDTCLSQAEDAYKKYITHDKICSLNINGSQVDRGDSGGALTYVKNNRHFIVGVVSTKIIGETLFSIFTDLSKTDIHTWIKEQTANLILPAYTEGYLLVYTARQLYITNAGSSKEFVFTEVEVSTLQARPAVDCVTGLMYWVDEFNIIKQGTVNGSNVEDFFVKEDSASHMMRENRRNQNTTRFIFPEGNSDSEEGSQYDSDAYPEFKTFLNANFSFDGLSLDWIDKKLYWTCQINGMHLLRATSIDSRNRRNKMKIETIIANLTGESKFLVVHPTLRKIYLLVEKKKVYSVYLESSTPTLTLYHEELAELSNIAIDWQTHDLCWLVGTSETTTIKCKNLLTAARRTVLSDYPRFQEGNHLYSPEGFIITPYNYYWNDRVSISRLSRSSPGIDNFSSNNTDDFPQDSSIIGVALLPSSCPHLSRFASLPLKFPD